MKNSGFFDSADDANLVKTRIVGQYFDAWWKVIRPWAEKDGTPIGYVDLFAGPGRYLDGTESTPLWVLQRGIEDQRLGQKLIAIFNDINPNHSNSLRQEIGSLPGVRELRYSPEVHNISVGPDITRILDKVDTIPTLFFVDPWGYKGMSLDLLGRTIRDWGCDCIFFFNYNRINPGLNNPAVTSHMADLFGEERFLSLRDSINLLSPHERELTIINEMSKSLRSVGGRYVLPFEFQDEASHRTSHYLVFVSKHFRGYDIMKDIMYRNSSDGAKVRHFGYAHTRYKQLQLLYDLANMNSIEGLEQRCLQMCSSRTMRVQDVHQLVTVDTPYVIQNVKDALIGLEGKGVVTIDPPAEKRPRRNGRVTLANDKMVRFP